MSKYFFEKEIRIFGLKRSGMHAASVWISGLFGRGKSVLQNNTHLTFRERLKSAKFELRLDRANDPVGYMNIIEHNNLREISAKLDDSNYEYNVEKVNLAKKHNKKFFSRDEYNILVIRNPFNNLASLSKMRPSESQKLISTFKEMWTQYAEEALFKTNYLLPKVVFLFDKWFVSKEYREELSESLGFPFTDLGLNMIHGSIGSSFDGKNFKREAQKMNVLGRWEQLENKEDYIHVLDRSVEKLWVKLMTKVEFGHWKLLRRDINVTSC